MLMKHATIIVFVLILWNFLHKFVSPLMLTFTQVVHFQYVTIRNNENQSILSCAFFRMVYHGYLHSKTEEKTVHIFV